MAPPYEMFATLAVDGNRDPILSVIAKRTYMILPDGKLRYAEKQLPLVREEKYEKRDGHPCEVPVAELDTWPIKPATDVVVVGRIHAPGGKPTPRMTAGVSVGEHAKVVEVFGDRTVDYLSARRPVFSPPTPFEAMEISYFRAYGGIDAALVREEPRTLRELFVSLTPEDRPGAYPRNPAGVGYVVIEDERTLEGMALPNFEDPRNLLTPERLIVRDPALWWRMPLPQGFGWFAAGWYPRSALAGLLPAFPPPDHSDEVEEVRRGYLPPGRSRFLTTARVEEWVDPRFVSGASPGLALPFLKGNEPVRLVGFSPDGEMRFALPGERPEVEIRFEKKRLKERLFLHTVLMEPDERRLALVWSARAKTPRMLPDRVPTNEDPMYDMLEGFEIRVDGVTLPHEREPFRPPSLF